MKRKDRNTASTLIYRWFGNKDNYYDFIEDNYEKLDMEQRDINLYLYHYKCLWSFTDLSVSYNMSANELKLECSVIEEQMYEKILSGSFHKVLLSVVDNPRELRYVCGFSMELYRRIRRAGFNTIDELEEYLSKRPATAITGIGKIKAAELLTVMESIK